MMLRRYGTHIITQSLSKTKSIENTTTTLPSCMKCVYYQPHAIVEMSKCTKFGLINMVTGEIKFTWADVRRADDFSCGQKGRDFEPKTNQY